ncbi:MAG TPA: S9 family peptidase [Patescibacteria group bacterium]|nr:S9 family peptidase [Patescibacteria group bacterium]
MKRSMLILALILLLIGSVAAQELDYLEKLPPIIDRDIFFGDPEIAGGQLSPDGAMLSFLKPFKGKLNIWIKTIDEPFEDARPITADTNRAVRNYTWSWDSRWILYVQDKGGDENFLAYRVDPYADPAPGQEVPEAACLTPFEGVRVMLYSAPRSMPDIAFVGLNDRDERYHDLYKLEISTGKLTLMRENSEELNLQGWIFDLEGNLRMAMRETDDGGTDLLRIDGDDFVSVYTTTNEENAGPVRFHKDGKRVYIETNKGEDVNLSRLILFDPVTLNEEIVEMDPKKQVDFGGVEFSNKTDEMVATYYVGDRLRTYFKDKEFENAYKKLVKQLPEGDVYFGPATLDDRLWLVTVTKDTDPGARYLYDMQTGEVKFLYRPRPELPVEHLAPMEPVRYTARDGLEISGYLTVPKGIKKKNLAVVVLPHGGPWARDYWGYDPYSQFLANRGYAVFQPNFRASTGFGKAFFNAGKKQWGLTMQDDITDGVKYLIDKGWVNPDKVAIFGGSYGGYATLAGLAFTPDIYAAGVDYVGVSNMLTFLNSIPAYWETARKFLNEQVGDPENPEDMERLKATSPLFSADNIQAPLLVVQGANDPRVKKPESDQIVIAMRERNLPVEYLVAADEGHGFLGVENRQAMVVAMEKFLAKHIGGRYQESVKPDIAKRLEEITVDVASVTLEKPEADPEAAKTAPLPKVDTALLKPMTLNYKATVTRAGQEIAVDITRTYEQATENGRDVWRTTTTQTSPEGTATDVFLVDRTTLLPIHRSVEQGQIAVEMEYTPETVTGTISMGPQVMPINTTLEAPVFGGDTAMEIALEALPLTSGYKTTLRVFELITQRSRTMLLEVTGMEDVTVPAGSFEAYKVELKPLDGELGGGTLFISEKDPRCIVRGTIQLPAAMGGGTATSELVGMK